LRFSGMARTWLSIPASFTTSRIVVIVPPINQIDNTFSRRFRLFFEHKKATLEQRSSKITITSRASLAPTLAFCTVARMCRTGYNAAAL
jgi:hypothetical protein